MRESLWARSSLEGSLVRWLNLIPEWHIVIVAFGKCAMGRLSGVFTNEGLGISNVQHGNWFWSRETMYQGCTYDMRDIVWSSNPKTN
jgi:hypothetical protein